MTDCRFPTMDGKNISVKAHMDHESGNSEVRRFGLDSSVATSFTYLQGKLRMAFPSLLRQPMEVTWLDGDGDWVTLSTDDELVLALTDTLQVRGASTLRLRVALATPRPQPRPVDADAVVHAGVQCDACNDTIRGYRYKCLTCDDFDLCGSCESKNLHPEHVMVRIATPEVGWQRFIRMGRRGNWRGPHCGRPAGPGPCGAAGFGGTGVSCNWKGRGNQQAKAAGAEETKKANASTNAASGQTNGQEAKCQPKNIFDAINAAMTALGGFPTESAGCPAANAGAAASRWSEKSLEEIGNKIAAFLDPFGIDVDVDVESRNPSTSSSQKKADKSGGKPANDKPQQQANAPEPMATNSEAEEPAVTPNEQATMMEMDSATANDVTPIPISVEDDESTDDWTVVNRRGSSSPSEDIGARPRVYPNLATEAPQPTSAAAAPSPMNAGAEAAPTAAPAADTAPPAVAAAAPSQAAAAAAPSAPVTIDESLDPRIQRALDVMAAMGFSNDGGWLTQLLQAKQGDIGAVLDVLQPVRPRQPQTY